MIWWYVRCYSNDYDNDDLNLLPTDDFLFVLWNRRNADGLIRIALICIFRQSLNYYFISLFLNIPVKFDTILRHLSFGKPAFGSKMVTQTGFASIQQKLSIFSRITDLTLVSVEFYMR